MNDRISDLEDELENLELLPFLVERKASLSGEVFTVDEVVRMFGFGELLGEAELRSGAP